MDRNDPGASHLFLVTVVFLWGANVAIVKSAYQDTHPVLFAAIRFTVSGILMLGFALWREKAIRIQREHWFGLLIMGGVGIGIYQILWSLGLQRTSATNSVLIFTVQPLLGALYVDWTKKEKVDRRRYVGMLIALAGVILVILKPTAKLHLSKETLPGDILNLISAACAAIFFTVWPKPLLRIYSSVRLMGYCMIIGSAVLWISILFGLRFTVFGYVGQKGWWPLFYAIFLSGIIGHTFWYEGIGRLGSTTTLLYLYFIPVWATVFNHFFIGEKIFTQQILGGGLILLGVHYALKE